MPDGEWGEGVIGYWRKHWGRNERGQHVEICAPSFPLPAGTYGALGNNAAVSNFSALSRVVGGQKWRQIQAGGNIATNYFT